MMIWESIKDLKAVIRIIFILSGRDRNYIEKKGTMNPKALNQWKFVPEKWTVPAAQRDSVYLFRSVQ